MQAEAVCLSLECRSLCAAPAHREVLAVNTGLGKVVLLEVRNEWKQSEWTKVVHKTGTRTIWCGVEKV